MKKVIKSLLSIVLVLAFVFETPVISYAHDADGHNKELESVLFGDGYSKYQSDEIKNDIKALEYASYLTVDQFNGDGEDKYNTLKTLKMGGLPRKFSTIDYSEDLTGSGKKITANTHRMYTHQGWDRDYTSKGKNIEKFWTARRKVLLGTVNSIFDFSTVTFLGYDERCESLAGIIYYVHIFGDYDEADNYKKIALLTDLAGRNNANADDKDYDMITSLKGYIEILFPDQTSSSDYKDLMDGLDDIADEAGALVQSVGGVNTDSEFEEYHQCADDILELLEEHLPKLLKNEDYFKSVFYPKAA